MGRTIELPKDAEGREIPLDTEVLYDEKGNERKVLNYIFNTITGNWIADFETENTSELHATEGFSLIPPDSWEKLLEDLETCDVCEYFGYLKRASKEDYGCANCQVYKTSENRQEDSDCLKRMFMDIASRIRKLRG